MKVKMQVAECKSRTSLEDRVRDKFVIGMKPWRILHCLFEKKLINILANLMDIAQSKEVLFQEVRQIKISKMQSKPLKERMMQPTKKFTKVDH